MTNLDQNELGNYIHILTDEDVENILIQIDSLYWAVMNLTKQRAVKINHDPNALSKEIRKM